MRYIFALVPLLLLVGMEWILYSAVSDYPQMRPVYIAISAIGYAGLLWMIGGGRSRFLNRTKLQNIIYGVTLSIIISKVIALPILLISNVLDAGFGLLEVPAVNVGMWLLLIPVSVLIAMLYGVFFGRYRYAVQEVTIHSDELPEEYDGYRIAQISDIHSGTWDDPVQVDRAVQKVQDQKADMIVFTGDLVNAHKDEINPFMDSFARLSAPDGKYAILGNHDYVGAPRQEPQRSAYWRDFLSKFDQMGFDLLLNEHRIIRRGATSIALIGVENWGSGRFFPKKGDLNKAMAGLADDSWRLLLSHDPSHWDEHVIGHEPKIHLTLSGHTHGMQFGINTRWLRWSPVQYRYPHWMGLYEEAGRQLYVNLGFGMLAFPGRVGMSSEITVITLRRD